MSPAEAIPIEDNYDRPVLKELGVIRDIIGMLITKRIRVCLPLCRKKKEKEEERDDPLRKRRRIKSKKKEDKEEFNSKEKEESIKMTTYTENEKFNSKENKEAIKMTIVAISGNVICDLPEWKDLDIMRIGMTMMITLSTII